MNKQFSFLCIILLLTTFTGCTIEKNADSSTMIDTGEIQPGTELSLEEELRAINLENDEEDPFEDEGTDFLEIE